jgi:ubiquinol-cytochrome c reductase cytochrome c1 subunit
MKLLTSLSLVALLGFAGSFGFGLGNAHASAAETAHPHAQYWPFEGPLGTFDKPSIQRGLQVYREVCAACHSLKRVPFRTLENVGFSVDEVKALAAEYTLRDGPNDDGEMFDRAGRPSDAFPAPYANEKAARAVNNGAFPPDLSLIIKARHDGANYLHALLTGYRDAPHGIEVPAGAYYNPYFPGGIIKMPTPLVATDQVTYQDGTKASVDQMAYDVTNFLQWAAEPEMQERKSMGVRVSLFLALMSLVFYIAKRRIWRDVSH